MGNYTTIEFFYEVKFVSNAPFEFFNYYIDSKGDLEAVHLRNPIRRDLDKDTGNDEDYYVIASRYLVIPNSNIINIHFIYFALKEVLNPTAEEVENVITLDNT